MHKFCKTLLLIVSVVSCTKQDTIKKDTSVCATTMAEIAGNYHLTKFESVSSNTGAAQDRTSALTSCELSGVYRLNIDSTVTYSELSTCNNSGTGIWQASEWSFYTFFASGTRSRIGGIVTSITGWDCTHLVLRTNYPTVDSNYRYTLTKF